MKRIALNIVAFFAVLSLSSCGYNSMVKLDEQVTSQWAQVENVYQRRVDLIPNLVSSVKGAANFEKETLTQVIEARSKATSINGWLEIELANLSLHFALILHILRFGRCPNLSAL